MICPAGRLLYVVLPKVWCKNVQHIDRSADSERWQHIVFIIRPWLLSQMAAVTCTTHITHRLITRSLFFTHTFSHTPTRQLLVHFMHTLMHFFNMPVVTASYCGSILPAAYPSVVAFIVCLFLVLSPRSHVSDTSPLILILSGVMLCNISLLSCPSFFLRVAAQNSGWAKFWI